MNVSLLVPCYNAAGFLPRLWETVRKQTRPFHEIVCYDDASTDDTARVARELGATVIRGDENRGPAYARNQLWRAATSDWVHFHDADDLMDAQFLEKMTARVRDEVDVVICNALWIHEESGTRELEWQYVERELLAAPVPYLLQHPVGGINGLYRRSALAAIGGFAENLQVWEDSDLHVRLAASGARFAVVEESLVIAMRRGTSVSAEMSRNWKNRLASLKAYAQTLPSFCSRALVAEAEIAARALVRLGEIESARQALALAGQLGGDPPTTGNAFIRLCKSTFGPMTALRLQALARRT